MDLVDLDTCLVPAPRAALRLISTPIGKTHPRKSLDFS